MQAYCLRGLNELLASPLLELSPTKPLEDNVQSTIDVSAINWHRLVGDNSNTGGAKLIATAVALSFASLFKLNRKPYF